MATEGSGLNDPDMETLHEVMSGGVRSLGVQGCDMSVSSRYGGATMIAAAGFPRYLIAHDGDGKSRRVPRAVRQAI